MRLFSPSMQRICLSLCALMAGCAALMPAPALALSMVFINPGKSTEPFWMMAIRNMQAVADSLDIELEVLSAERDYLAQIRLTQEVVERPAQRRPDYLIIVAEKGTLLAQLELADEAGIATFLAFNTVADSDRPRVGHPRGRFTHWLGSLAPMAQEGGYLSARALMEHALARLPAGATPGLIALAGDRSTDTSLRRNQGLHRALAEFPQVRLHQLVYADWSYDKAVEQAGHLFRRYPQAQLVWSGSDLLAFGAMQALRDSPQGTDRAVFFSGINATSQALEALLSGELSTLSGGHHMAGAWAMVLLHDHYHGLDFVETAGGVEQEYVMFALLDERLARQLLDRRAQNATIDFCSHSRVCNPARAHYDFSFASWLESER